MYKLGYHAHLTIQRVPAPLVPSNISLVVICGTYCAYYNRADNFK